MTHFFQRETKNKQTQRSLAFGASAISYYYKLIYSFGRAGPRQTLTISAQLSSLIYFITKPLNLTLSYCNAEKWRVTWKDLLMVHKQNYLLCMTINKGGIMNNYFFNFDRTLKRNHSKQGLQKQDSADLAAFICCLVNSIAKCILLHYFSQASYILPLRWWRVQYQSSALHKWCHWCGAENLQGCQETFWCSLRRNIGRDAMCDQNQLSARWSLPQAGKSEEKGGSNTWLNPISTQLNSRLLLSLLCLYLKTPPAYMQPWFIPSLPDFLAGCFRGLDSALTLTKEPPRLTNLPVAVLIPTCPWLLCLPLSSSPILRAFGSPQPQSACFLFTHAAISPAISCWVTNEVC